MEGPVTYNFTLHLRVCDHTTWFWRCLGTTFGHFLLGSHHFKVICLHSCVWSGPKGSLHTREWRPVTILKVFSLLSQELWPWNCESPKEMSKSRPKHFLNHVVCHGPSSVVWSRMYTCLNQILFEWFFIYMGPTVERELLHTSLPFIYLTLKAWNSMQFKGF